MKKKWTFFLLAALIALLLLGEGVSRWWLGLGDPPLTVTHPQIEYMFKPSAAYRRFGNDLAINAYGMRSADFPAERQGSEVRLLVIGDSIVNGGNLTDQRELATELLRRSVAGEVGGEVFVGNISAGSWGPGNQLAYVNTFGTFDADAAVIVLNSGDLYDVPTFEPLNRRTHPTQKPFSALVELVDRYGVPRLEALLGRTPAAAAPAAERQDTLAELDALVSLLQRSDVSVAIVYHSSRSEFAQGGGQGAEPGGESAREAFRQYSERLGIPFYTVDDLYRSAMGEGRQLFRDNVHPNAYGQSLLAARLMEILSEQGWLSAWKQRAAASAVAAPVSAPVSSPVQAAPAASAAASGQ